MSAQFHPTAIISSTASVGSRVEIGPYSLVEDGVVVADDCWIGSHVILRTGLKLGKRCRVFHGAVLGEIPQDLKFEDEHTGLKIGDDVIIREYVTVNRGTKARGETEIGNHTYLMAYVHVAHDCVLGEHVILANGVQLGGHVKVDDWANIGGMSPVHQYCKIGKYAFIAGGFRAVQDVPPYILAAGEPLRYSGLNSVGLRRQGFSADARKSIKAAYQLIYRSSLNRRQAIEEIKKTLPQNNEIQEIIAFIESSDRGII